MPVPLISVLTLSVPTSRYPVSWAWYDEKPSLRLDTSRRAHVNSSVLNVARGTLKLEARIGWPWALGTGKQPWLHHTTRLTSASVLFHQYAVYRAVRGLKCSCYWQCGWRRATQMSTVNASDKKWPTGAKLQSHKNFSHLPVDLHTCCSSTEAHLASPSHCLTCTSLTEATRKFVTVRLSWQMTVFISSMIMHYFWVESCFSYLLIWQKC